MADAVNLTAPSQVRELLTRHGLRANRRLGQHFLVDANILAKVVEAAGLTPADCVLEVGAGLGVLTRELAARAGRVLAVELDRGLLPVLAETLAGLGNVELIHGDALALDLRSLAAHRPPAPGGVWKAVANLPYQVTGPLIMGLLGAEDPAWGASPFRLGVFMVQWEVARRLLAAPGSGDYGAFTVLARYRARVELVTRVSPRSFLPPPEVESAVVRLAPHSAPPVEARAERLRQVVRAAFGQRRKSLRNALAALPAPWGGPQAAQLLAAGGIAGERRGETLSLEEFAALARAMDHFDQS